MLRMKYLKTNYFSAIAVFTIFLLPLFVFAADNPNTLKNPLKYDSICQIVGLLINAVVVIGIPIAILFIVWAGFKFILARGSANELSEARTNLWNTLIGVAIFVGASVIAGVIINTLSGLGVSISSCL